MNSKMYFSESESKPGVFEKNKKFRLKSNFVPPMEYTAVNNFCWNIRDAINILFEKDIVEKQNLSNKEKSSLKTLMKTKTSKFALTTQIKILVQLVQIKSTLLKNVTDNYMMFLHTKKSLSWKPKTLFQKSKKI